MSQSDPLLSPTSSLSLVDKANPHNGLSAGIRNRHRLAQHIMLAIIHHLEPRKYLFIQKPVVPPLRVKDVLIQITAAPVARKPATLSPALLSVGSSFYKKQMVAVEQQETALEKGHSKLLKKAHFQLSLASKAIRKECHDYAYPPPSQQDPNRWDIFCKSGRHGRFLRSSEACLSCAFFNQSYNPKFADKRMKPPKAASVARLVKRFERRPHA